MLELIINCNSFKQLKLVIRPETFEFEGDTRDYSHDNPRSYCDISFRVSGEELTSMINKIKEQFKLNTDYCNVDDYVIVRTEFADWETDHRPRISIKFNSGYRGMTSPPKFWFKAIA